MSDVTTMTTGEVRLSYVHLFKPYAKEQGQEEKFSCTILVPKSDTATMGRINAAIEAAKQKGIRDKWNGNCPPMVPTPVYDGDGVRPSDGSEFGPECKGHWVFAARSKADFPPEIVDQNINPVINQSEIYSGIYARVSLSFYPYYFGGKKGIGCGLNAVQKLRDGEPLAESRVTASDAFGSAAPQPAAPAAYQGQPPYNQHGYGQPPQPNYTQPPQNYGQPLQPGYTPVPPPQPNYTQPTLAAAGYGQYPQALGQGPAAGGINPITGLPY